MWKQSIKKTVCYITKLEMVCYITKLETVYYITKLETVCYISKLETVCYITKLVTVNLNVTVQYVEKQHFQKCIEVLNRDLLTPWLC